MGDPDRFLYPAIEPYNTEFLKVSEEHTIYFEECGSKTGKPVVFLHGGPGASISERDRRYFDPTVYRVILFDQRGCGKSTPSFSVQSNTTWNLIEDMEKLRNHLGIEKWLIFGGSWGSTLALLYAETHIDRVSGMILQGVFTFRNEEFGWLYQQGASYIFPDYWEEYVAPIPEDERDDLFAAFYKRVRNVGENREEAVRCARAMAIWDACNTRLRVNPGKLQGAREADSEILLNAMKIGNHYFAFKGFLKTPNQILDNVKIIKDSGIPVIIVQGRYDVVAPIKTAWELHRALPESEIHVVADAGHSPKEEGITEKLVEACNKMKSIDL